MAKAETTPVSIPENKRAGKKTAIALAAALTAGTVGVGAIALTRGQEQTGQEPPPPSPVATLPPERASTMPSPTVESTPSPTEKPTPTPTEKPLTDQEKIELARKAQREALAENKLKIPLSEELEKLGAKVEEVYVPQTNGYFLRISGLPAGKEVSFPSLIDGTVLESRRINRNATKVVTQIGNYMVEYSILNTASDIINAGDKISLGDTLFSFTYLPNDSVQKGYEQAGVGSTPGMVMKIFAYSSTDAQNFTNLRLETNVIKKASGGPLSIPTTLR